MWDALYDEGKVLSFIIAACPRQPSPSWILLLRDSGQYFTLSDSRISQSGEPGPLTYIPHEQGGPVISPGAGFTFVASYNSQGYGGAIRTHLHMGLTN
jgi:hypothetical protein